MRISKNTANLIAKELIKEKEKQVEALRTEYRQYVTDCYNAQVPDEVKKVQAKHPDFFCTRSSISFSGHGFSWEQISVIGGNVITNSETVARLELNDRIATKAKKLQNKYIDAKKKLSDLQRQIEVTLIGLGTFKNIQEHLPEAVPFLPKSTSVELIVNFDVLRADINKKTI